MSDRQLIVAIEQMEAWLANPTWEPDAEALIRWNEVFQAAAAHPEKGEGWSDLVARAHAAGHALDARVVEFVQLRDRLKAALDTQEQGNRALRGYKTTAG
jgi:hypothetical protein